MTDIKSAPDAPFLSEEEVRQGIELLFFAYRDFTAEPAETPRLPRHPSGTGFRVTGAADAAEARAQLASFAFDLIVLDVMMPGESGLVLTRALRERPAPRIPVLLLTAMGEPEDRVNGLEQGADDYLAKPFEPRELVLRIRNILQRRPEPAAAVGEVRFGTFRFDLARAELFRG